LTDITANKPPLFKFEKFLDKEESLSAFAVDEALTGVVATAAKLKAKSGFAGTSKRIRKL
jgi:hypothetical protein